MPFLIRQLHTHRQTERELWKQVTVGFRNLDRAFLLLLLHKERNEVLLSGDRQVQWLHKTLWVFSPSHARNCTHCRSFQLHYLDTKRWSGAAPSELGSFRAVRGVKLGFHNQLEHECESRTETQPKVSVQSLVRGRVRRGHSYPKLVELAEHTRRSCFGIKSPLHRRDELSFRGNVKCWTRKWSLNRHNHLQHEELLWLNEGTVSMVRSWSEWFSPKSRCRLLTMKASV